jgi:hypothetical protein
MTVGPGSCAGIGLICEADSFAFDDPCGCGCELEDPSSVVTPMGCSLVGCSDGVGVQLIPTTERFAPGDINVSVSVDGGPLTQCTLSRFDDDQTTRTDCDTEGVVEGISLSFGEDCLEAMFEGTPCTPSEQSSLWVRVLGIVGNVIVGYVGPEGDEAQFEITPTYEPHSPNGRECNPTCFSASATFELP